MYKLVHNLTQLCFKIVIIHLSCTTCQCEYRVQKLHPYAKIVLPREEKKNCDLIFKYVIFVTSAALHFCSSFQVSFVDQIRYNETNERERFSFLVFTIQIQVRYHVKPELISLTFCNLPNMHIQYMLFIICQNIFVAYVRFCLLHKSVSH